MSVKIFGSSITDEATANILGAFVSAVYVFGLCFIGWIAFQLYYYTTLRDKQRGRTFYLIVGGVVGAILMAVDTQIELFIAPKETPSWPSITSFLGFSYITVFVVCPWLRIVYALSARTKSVPSNPNSKQWIRPTLIVTGLIYMLVGFVIFLFCTFMTNPTIILKGSGMAIFLFGATVLWFAFFVAIRNASPGVIPLGIVAGFVVLMLSLYAGFYFVKDIYARGIEFATETVILVLLWIYAWLILKAHKETFPEPSKVESQVPLMHNYVGEEIVVLNNQLLV